MRELQQKQKTKQRLYSVPVLVVLAIVVAFLLRGTYQVIQKDMASADSVKELESKNTELSQRETELKGSIDRLGTDDGVDAEIKDKFSVSKPGEHVAVIVDEKQPATSTSSSSSWYQKLWNSLKGL